MKFKNLFITLTMFLLVVTLRNVHAIGYPALDTTSKWNIGSFGYEPGVGVYLRNVGKNVWTSPGVSQSKTVFYELSVLGVKKGSQEIILNAPFQIYDQAAGLTPPFNYFTAQFRDIDPNVNLDLYFEFDPDGKYSFSAVFWGSGYHSSDNWTIINRIDYDIGGSNDNTVEFLWNQSSEGLSLSPPQYPNALDNDGVLVYAPPSSGKSDYWSTVNHEISVAYGKLNRLAGPSVENRSFARIINTNDPQFGIELFSDTGTSTTATFKVYGYGSTLNPTVDITNNLQMTSEYGNYPRHATFGRDQMMYLKLNVSPSSNPNPSYYYSGKVFQRPYDGSVFPNPSGARPLVVRIYQHPVADMGGWRFSPDWIVKNVNGISRTFRNALADLTGASNLVIMQSGDPGMPYLPYSGYAGAGQSISEASLHNLMVNTRNYSISNLNNLREWQIDIFIVNWTLVNNPDTWDDMFDYGGFNTNHIAREGSAVMWKALTNKGTDGQRKQTILSALRGIGSQLNMAPQWSSCPFIGYCWNNASGCGGKTCGSSCPSGVSGCHYSPYYCEKECMDGTVMSLVDYNHSSFQFNSLPAQGSSSSEVDWYRHAPEGWVKPGSNGMSYISGPMPQF